MRASLCRCGNRMVQDCIDSCGCSFRVYHFHNVPVPTVLTGLRICQNDVLQGGSSPSVVRDVAPKSRTQGAVCS